MYDIIEQYIFLYMYEYIDYIFKKEDPKWVRVDFYP
jgi:hypothetical protein